MGNGGVSMKIEIDMRVKVIGQDITGIVVEDYGNKVVIIDDHAETYDDRLEFKVSDLEEVEEVEGVNDEKL